MYEDPGNDVIDYWDQPPTFIVRFVDDKGRSRGHKCTPDFFVLRNDPAGWEGWRTEDKLIELAQERPEWGLMRAS